MNNIQILFFIIISLAALITTACDADWLMGHYRVRFLVKTHGRDKARTILLYVFAAMVAAGIIWLYISG